MGTRELDGFAESGFVVAYGTSEQPGSEEQSGMFVTAVRDGYAGRWRFLEATVVP